MGKVSDFSKVAELERRVMVLEDACAQTQALATTWMRKHDALLGWIQQRPAILKELIESEERIRK